MQSHWKIKAGERIYAIGDIHGCNDLLAEILSQIRLDNASRPTARTGIIVLGDVIDRGPDSAGLIARLMRYTRYGKRFTVLRGNHEQTMLAALSGNVEAAKAWLKIGGRQTLESWGVAAELLDQAPLQVLMTHARLRIPAEVTAWVSRLPLYKQSGSVVFVHAGIKPGVALDKQDPNDLMWIRDGFVDCPVAHPFLVVHGHTIVENGPDFAGNRIGLDTGAYRTGRLTALGLEGDRTWTLATGKSGCASAATLDNAEGADGA